MQVNQFFIIYSNQQLLLHQSILQNPLSHTQERIWICTNLITTEISIILQKKKNMHYRCSKRQAQGNIRSGYGYRWIRLATTDDEDSWTNRYMLIHYPVITPYPKSDPNPSHSLLFHHHTFQLPANNHEPKILHTRYAESETTFIQTFTGMYCLINGLRRNVISRFHCTSIRKYSHKSRWHSIVQVSEGTHINLGGIAPHIPRSYIRITLLTKTIQYGT